jgi:hypothetical protein
VPVQGPGRLKKPASVKADKEGNFYVLDLGSRSVKKFSPEGAYLQGYSASESESADPYGPIDFTVNSQGWVWTCQLTEGLLGFSPEGQLASEIPTLKDSLRVAIAEEQTFTVLTMDENLFHSYSSNGEAQSAFGSLIEQQGENSIALDGWIDGDREGSLYYASRSAGLIAAYGPTGRVRFLRQTIDPIPLPELELRGGARIIAPGDRSAVSMNVDGDQIYVLAEVDYRRSTRHQVIDVYSKKDGSYLYSRRLPQVYAYAFAAGSRLYTVSEGQVTVWREAASVAESGEPLQ